MAVFPRRLTIAADGDILPLMIILPGETDHAIKDLTVLDNLFIATHGKSWTDEYQMGF